MLGIDGGGGPAELPTSGGGSGVLTSFTSAGCVPAGTYGPEAIKTSISVSVIAQYSRTVDLAGYRGVI